MTDRTDLEQFEEDLREQAAANGRAGAPVTDASIDELTEMQLRERLTVLEEWQSQVDADMMILAAGLVVLAVCMLLLRQKLRGAS